MTSNTDISVETAPDADKASWHRPELTALDVAPLTEGGGVTGDDGLGDFNS